MHKFNALLSKLWRNGNSIAVRIYVYVYINLILLFLLLLCQLLQQMYTQVIFETTPQQRQLTTVGIVNNGQQCLCYAGTTCPGGIDIRIVNTGTTCPSGEVYCCATPNPIPNVSCGIRRISPIPHPPAQAARGAYPWQVAILTNGDFYIGGGVLVDPMYVLTAAHKVADYINSGIKARLGAWDIQNTIETKDISISNIDLHPNYNISQQNIYNDIAVLKLSSAAPIATSPNINTACLPSGPVAADTRCWVTGWGKNAFGPSGMYSNILKEVDVLVLSQDTCQTELRKTKLSNSFILDDNSLCAGGEMGKDACTGDGGSPLVCSNSENGPFQVVGLVIWGIGCADAKIPGVYTNVYKFLSWIKEKMT